MTTKAKRPASKRQARASWGSRRQLPSGRWQAHYIDPTGIRQAAPTTFDTKADADAWLAMQRAAITLGAWKPPDVRPATAYGFETFAETWLAGRDLKPRTAAHYRQLLDLRILPVLGKLDMRTIRPEVIDAWYAGLDAKRPTMRAHAYGLLKTILKTATQRGLIPFNPCMIERAGSTKRAHTIKTASLAELAALIDAMPAKYRAAVLLSSWCGLRFGELTELRRKDVDLDEGVIKIRRAVAWVDSRPVVGAPKSDAGIRDVAIPPHLIPAIGEHVRDYAQEGEDGLLFPSPQGAHLTTSTLYASFWRARKLAGRPDLRWHDLRHTGATLAAQSGATLAELMSRLGHSTPAAALIYQHAAEGRDKALAARLSAMAEAP